MKLSGSISLLLFTTLAAPFAVAANNIPQVQHVIVVIVVLQSGGGTS
jgi:hypothetical protein